jgi:hypothetical protein
MLCIPVAASKHRSCTSVSAGDVTMHAVSASSKLLVRQLTVLCVHCAALPTVLPGIPDLWVAGRSGFHVPRAALV